MDIKRTQKLLKYCMTGKVPALLVGHSGVGKSAVVEQTSKKLLPNHQVIKLMLSQCDIGDLIGLPNIQTVQYEGTTESGLRNFAGISVGTAGKTTFEVTEWARPAWMPFGPVTLFLDELNQANRDVESAAFQLVYEGRIHNHFLHPDSVVIAAVNPSTAEYTTANAISSALVKRFVIIPFQPNAQEVIAYGKESQEFHSTVLKFMEFDNSHVGVSKPLEIGMEIEPTPRTWAMFSKLVRAAEASGDNPFNNLDILTDMLTSTVGTATAAAFLSKLESEQKPLEFEAVFQGWNTLQSKFEEFRKEGREDLVSITVNNVFDGLFNYGQSFTNKFKFTGYVNNIDSKDSLVKKTALRELQENTDLYDKVGLSNINLFVEQLPKDLFYQFVYNFISKEVVTQDMDQAEIVSRANAHYALVAYMFTGSLKDNKNLWPKIKLESAEMREFAKTKKSM